MLRRALSLALLLSVAPMHAWQTRAQATAVNLDSPMLRAVDGTPFIHIGNIMYMGKQLMKLLSKQPMIYVASEDRYMTVRQLEEKEQERSRMDEATQASLDDALKEALDIFADLTRPYLAEIKGAKEHMIGIINTWKSERKREDTYLIQWANIEGNEEEALYRNITSFTQLDAFLDDLSVFLADLVQNCPISYGQYKEQRAQEKTQ